MNHICNCIEITLCTGKYDAGVFGEYCGCDEVFIVGR